MLSAMRNAALALFLVAGSAFAQQPRIDSISPAQGPIAGGTTITVTGANFSGTTVALDRIALTPLSQSNSAVRLQLPPHDNGYAIVSIRNADGAAYGEFLYVPPRLETLPPGSITTIAGVGRYDHAFGRASEAMIKANGFAFDEAGNTYIADPNGNRIYLVHAAGTIERFAGNGDPRSSSGDGGPALDASFSFPRNVALDGAGNVYIPDANYRIRKVGADGVIQTVAGTGTKGFTGDGGSAIGAPIGYPSWIAADRDDLFFIEEMVRVRRIHLADGTISTVAGDGIAGFAGDMGPATQARFFLPGYDDGGLALDAAGNVYLLDSGNGRIRKIDRKNGIIDTVVTVRDTRGDLVKLSSFAVGPDGQSLLQPRRVHCEGRPDRRTAWRLWPAQRSKRIQRRRHSRHVRSLRADQLSRHRPGREHRFR